MRMVFFVIAIIAIGRLFQLQILQHDTFAIEASALHDARNVLLPQRGTVWVRESEGGGESALFPITRNVKKYLVYAVPRDITDPEGTVAALGPLLGLSHDELLPRVAKSDDPYEPLLHFVSDETRTAIVARGILGIGFQPEYAREYPEGETFGVLTGFVQGTQEERRGQYGIEQGFDDALRGIPGVHDSERDARGNIMPVGRQRWDDPVQGSDIVLTIDHAIQYRACARLEQAVRQHDARAGALIVLDPVSGAIRALCSSPRYDPNEYGAVKDLGIFMNQAVSGAWEPGSIFKAITMAGALERNAVTPATTFTDTGSVTLDKETIKNADQKTYGTVSMTDVLTHSINTGAVYAQQQMGTDAFREMVQQFGFGALWDIGMPAARAGDIRALDKPGEIFAATASFGQGITVTPLQMAAAFAAIANGGVLMRPYIVEEIRHADGTVDRTVPQEVRRVISPKTATLVRAMLVTVVEEGHGTRAGVKGFWVAGKTGTAQVATPGTRGYDPHKTIGSFVGFAPTGAPRFVILTRIDEPKTVKFAESTAAPLFGEIAEFLLQYYRISPEREVNE